MNTIYDLTQRKPMNLKQRPLLVMECTIIGKAYKGLGISSESQKQFDRFKTTSQQLQGDFIMLWHNSYFSESRGKGLYEYFIR